MKLIKLDAIDSTNTFLKELADTELLENYTTVVANQQLKGRGQMHTDWISEPSKNLLCSVFCRFDNMPFSNRIYLNYAIALSVYKTLKAYNLPKLSIKWPNDILSEKNKVSGILVETTIKKHNLDSVVIGVGLNANQEFFSDSLLNVSSIKKATQKSVDLDELLNVFVNNLKEDIQHFVEKNFSFLEESYLSLLYKKNIPTMFKTSKNVLFMGMIIGVATSGKLQIQLEDDSIKEFGIKEVSFAN